MGINSRIDNDLAALFFQNDTGVLMFCNSHKYSIAQVGLLLVFFDVTVAFVRDRKYLVSRNELWSIFYGWDGGIRTPECWDQNPVPYHLATSQ